MMAYCKVWGSGLLAEVSAYMAMNCCKLCSIRVPSSIHLSKTCAPDFGDPGARAPQCQMLHTTNEDMMRDTYTNYDPTSPRS